jgi:hypothetical protein
MKQWISVNDLGQGSDMKHQRMLSVLESTADENL